MSNTPAQTEQSQPINLFELPNTYVNGFTYHATLGDVMLVLQTNGRPVGTLNMSFTVAKTLAHKLGEMVQQFQERSGRTLLTLDEVADNLRQAHEDARDVAAVADAAQKPRRNGQRNERRSLRRFVGRSGRHPDRPNERMSAGRLCRPPERQGIHYSRSPPRADRRWARSARLRPA